MSTDLSPTEICRDGFGDVETGRDGDTLAMPMKLWTRDAGGLHAHPRLVQSGRYLRMLFRAIPSSLYDLVFTSARSISFSNYGEDLLLTRMFRLPQQGFYVDIGANDPIVASNTLRLDLMGWQGVAIEPNPDFAARFARIRPGCKVVINGVGERNEALDYIQFTQHQCNTFNPALAEMARQRGIREIGRKQIAVRPLRDMLADHVGDRSIDVMSIDIEGYEMPAFHSNDWSRWVPAIILAEDHLAYGESIERSQLAGFLRERGYQVAARVHFTTFFLHRDHAAAFTY